MDKFITAIDISVVKLRLSCLPKRVAMPFVSIRRRTDAFKLALIAVVMQFCNASYKA